MSANVSEDCDGSTHVALFTRVQNVQANVADGTEQVVALTRERCPTPIHTSKSSTPPPRSSEKGHLEANAIVLCT
jgi:hypothetical protein